MARLCRLFIYGCIVGVLTSSVYCVRIADEKRSRLSVIKSVLCDQMKVLSRIVNNEELDEIAEKVKYEKF